MPDVETTWPHRSDVLNAGRRKPVNTTTLQRSSRSFAITAGSTTAFRSSPRWDELFFAANVTRRAAHERVLATDKL